jgi:hypothetical protein
MANTFTIQTSSYDGRYLKLTCRQEQNIQDNQSTIYWTLESIGGSVNYYATGPTKVWINGELVFTRARLSNDFPALKGSKSGYTFVSHNADGKKTISITLQTGIYTTAVGSYGGAWILDDIPRAATITSVSNFNDETNPTITYSNPWGSNVSALQAFIYAADYKTLLVGAKDLNKNGASYTYSLTAAEKAKLSAASINSKALTVYFVIKTTINGTTYNSNWVEKTVPIVNANPAISWTVEDVNPDTLFLTGDPNRIVIGHSNVKYTLTATPKKGSTITTYSVQSAGQRLLGTTNIFNNSESNVFQAVVVDTRGNMTTDTITKTLVDYVPVSCNQTVQMELEGTTGATAKVSVNGNYFNQDFGEHYNQLVIEYRIATNNGSYGAWKAVYTTPTYNSGTYSLTFSITGLNYENSYKIQTKAYDALTESVSAEYVAKLKPVFDWGRDDFSFNVPVSIEGVKLDYIVDQGTKDSWTYRKWSSGIMEVWRRYQITTSVNSAWGNVYTSGILANTNLRYPIEFKETPILTATLMPFGSGGILMAPGNGYGSTAETGAFEILRGTALSSGQFLIAYHAIGKWK